MGGRYSRRRLDAQDATLESGFKIWPVVKRFAFIRFGTRYSQGLDRGAKAGWRSKGYAATA